MSIIFLTIYILLRLNILYLHIIAFKQCQFVYLRDISYQLNKVLVNNINNPISL